MLPELRRKRSAEVVAWRRLPVEPAGVRAGLERWYDADPARLLKRVRRAQARGELATAGPMTQVPPSGPYAGQYRIVVKLLAAPRRRRTWPWWVAGGAVAAVLLLWLAINWQAVLLTWGAVGAGLYAASRPRHRGACIGLHCEGCRR